MSVLLQVSDPHFGTEQAPVVEALLQLIHDLGPDLVVLSGDITQRARRLQFEAASRFLGAMQRPYMVVPGNHDIPMFNLPVRFTDPYAGYRRSLGDDLEPQVETDDLLIIGLNTARRLRQKNGQVSPAQVERSCARLRQARAGQLRIVVTHHPVHVTRRVDEGNVLHGSRDAVAAWNAAGADLLMGGHIHLPYVRPLGERYAGLRRPMWAVQAGTAISRRIRGGMPNSVNVVRYDPHRAPGQCLVERWDYAVDELRFQPVHTHELALDHAPIRAGR